LSRVLGRAHIRSARTALGSTMIITQDWVDAIDGFLAHHRAAGYPATTQRTRREHLQHLARRIGTPPQLVTEAQLVDWFASQNWANSTRRSRRQTFRLFWGWMRSSGQRKTNPAKALPKVRTSLPIGRPVPARVYVDAFLHADRDERVWMELAYHHGLRRGEIAGIHSRDILEDAAGHTLIVHGKGGRDRDVPLLPAMADALLAYGAGYLFPGDEVGHISARWLGKRVNRHLEAPWTIHKLRHAAVTRWERAGGLIHAQRLAGHASVATTQLYVGSNADELRATLVSAAA
jgi:integrase/recombinase XerC